MKTVQRTIELSSNIHRGCDHCNESFTENVSEGINHLISAHGYRLLHVGTESTLAQDGSPYHTTVAILGHDEPPALKPKAKIVFGQDVPVPPVE